MKNSRISLAFKALRELGPRQLGLFAFYQIGLRTGYFRWRTSDDRRLTTDDDSSSIVCQHLFALPDPETLRGIIGSKGIAQLKAEADEIVEGRVRLFGGPPVPLNLSPPGELTHWTDYARGKSPFPEVPSEDYPIPDIKFIWEPARFVWAFSLGRAYHLTCDERYSAAFWHYFEVFRELNPANQGPNWESAQEVALRLMAFSFAVQTFAKSPHSTVERQTMLAQALAEHAARIPPTLIYARAQNNNHLLSEAVGLITASLALPEHPQARHWAKLGKKWFKRGLQTQIAKDGSYIQQSTNYHRLLLQVALWVCQMQNAKGRGMKDESIPLQPLTPHLQRATQWLLALTDPISGRVPNLGPNDGAYILPFTNLPFADYRPVLQAASQAFLGQPAFAAGPWDEMYLWFQAASCKPQGRHTFVTPNSKPLIPLTLHTPYSWAYLRAAHFRDRPGHADQLHLDLWWRGLNITQDAGTYLYNAEPPWDNALTHTAVHNTVLLDGREQMTPAGRFLYLDQAQAEVLQREQAEDGAWERIVASHAGYLRAGIMHIRSVTAYREDRWVVEDRLQPLTDDVQRATHLVRLQWLLPDWAYEMRNVECGMQNAECRMQLESPKGKITLGVGVQVGDNSQLSADNLQLIRAGELLYGSGPVSSTWGWVSPTYGVKEPALSFAVTVSGELPLTFTSEWSFPNG